MQISLSPRRRDDALTVFKDGDVLNINGAAFDFSGLPEGATIPIREIPCEWIEGPVERISGSLRLTLILPHGHQPSEAVAYPERIIDPPDGILVLPFDLPPVEPDEPEEEPDNVEG